MPKLCIALDLDSKDETLSLVRDVRCFDKELWLKIGLKAYLRDGVSLLEEIRALGEFKLFLDLKLYDIPNTMLDAVNEIAKLRVNMLTIHASSGIEAMKLLSAQSRARDNFPLILAVSALTSFDTQGFELIYNAPLANHARKMAMLADSSGIDGVVCSCFEVSEIKAYTNPNFLTLTPGIRPFNESSNDQKRVADLEMAKRVGSDFIVIGRPIYRAKEPLGVVEKILENLT